MILDRKLLWEEYMWKHLLVNLGFIGCSWVRLNVIITCKKYAHKSNTKSLNEQVGENWKFCDK